MKLQLVASPHAVLSTHADEVLVFDERLRRTIAVMEKVLVSCKDPEGVGLAAPQVGLSLRMFLMKPTQKSKTKVFINPVIIATSPSTKTPEADMLEGCLSVKNVWAHIDRPLSVTIRFQDEFGHEHTQSFTDFEALIVQHEIDHLNGILFTQRALEQSKTLYRMIKKNGNETFEEIGL